MDNSKKIDTKKRILIVEDEAIVASDIKTTLVGEGYEITDIISTGEMAIKIAEKKSPDLVIMDIKLIGKMDGIEAAREIKKLNIPVIYVTAYGDKQTIERAKETTPHAFIHKPFDAKEILSAVELGIYKNELEGALEESEERFRVFFNQMADAVAIVDKKGVILEVSDKIQSVTGYVKKDLVEKNILTLPIFDVVTKAKLIKNVALRLAGVDIKPYEVLVHKKDGTVTPMEINGRSVHYRGKIVDMAVFRDVTERKRADAALLEKIKELEQANKIMTGRELRMVELKNRIKELEQELEKRK